MDNYPKMNEIIIAVMNDCYNFLDKYSDKETKNSMNNILKAINHKDEQFQWSYLVLCSIHPFESTREGNLDIIFFYKKYISTIYYYLYELKNDSKAKAKINDCCMAYIALYGFKYNYNGVAKEDLFKFLHSNYDNFSNKLNEYAILETIKEYYEKSITPLIKYNYNEFVIRLIQKFHDDITIPIINFSYINTIENRLTRLEKEIAILKKDLKNSNFNTNSNIKFINITNSIEKNVILEKFIIYPDFSSTIMKINEKKISN